MFKIHDTVFVLVDVQGKLARAVFGVENLFGNLAILVRGMRILEIPVIWVEQIPGKMGPTVPEISGFLDGLTPVSKSCFSCWGEPDFRAALQATDRRQVVLAGIETHVCICQTVSDLTAENYEVQVAGDAVSSRTRENRDIGLEKVRSLGAGVTSAEMILFELLQTSEHPSFREILKLVK